MTDDYFRDIMRVIRDPSLDGRVDLIKGYFPFETIKYSGTLRFPEGRHHAATFERHQKIRFIEDGVGIFFDRVWGDGVLFGGYSAPGLRILQPIRDASGYIIPLMLPRLYKSGETFTVVTKRKTVAAFYDAVAYWETAMHAPTDLVSIKVIAENSQLKTPALIAPPKGDLEVKQRNHRLDFRVARPALYTPYRLIWSWN